jgi:type I restriction enzyme S subunit
MANIYAAGAAQPDLPHTSFKKIKIPICSLPIQNKIASILSAYDNLIEANSRRIKILEQMAANLYKEWFVRFRFLNSQNTPIEN